MALFSFSKKFPHIQQLDQMDCGTTCIRMIAKFYGRNFSKQYLDEKSYKGRTGVNLLNLSEAAESVGFRTMSVKCSFDLILKEKPVPFIAHWRGNHFVVVYKITNKHVYISDPEAGLIKLTVKQFCEQWYYENVDEGVALFMQTTPELFTFNEGATENKKIGFGFYLKYIIPHYKLLFQLGIGLLLVSVFSLITPFLTQALVDQGIQQSNIKFVYMVLLAQIMLFVGGTVVGAIRSWIALHMTTRINISILSDFLVKMMKLPISFFDSKNLGDIMQRMGDHSRIEHLLTSKSLETLFSLFNVIVYSFIMLSYSKVLYAVFMVITLFDILYIILFLKKRKKLDYLSFEQSAENQNVTVQLIQGMQEIKLHTCEKEKRWKWERVQIKLFRLKIKTLILEQFQDIGGESINQIKNILIAFLAAREVIEGNMTLGMMMAATQILGLLNGPISQLALLIQDIQDAKIGLDRLGEVQNREDEDHDLDNDAYIIPEKEDIVITNLGFRYGDPTGEWVLKDLNLTIPFGKTTAIVGESGSGKTTLLKLLLRFYEPEEGAIKVSHKNLSDYSAREWRKKCGVVMQQGYIFSDTIANNISVSEEIIDKERLINAVETANIRSLIESMPKNYNTKIGDDGKQLSTGQKQRILIARAVYKNPDYLFFDEASSALDAKNEREITDKLAEFNRSRTAVVIAHRLSTVRNADNIVVLEKGKIVEQGTHNELVQLRGVYYNLVVNQLELSE